MSIYDIEQKTKRELVEIVKIQQEHGMQREEYIKTLQAENERLKHQFLDESALNQSMFEEIEKLKQRCEQAERGCEEWVNAIIQECAVYHSDFCPDDPVKTLKTLLSTNAKWALDPQVSSDAANFAIEQQIKGVESNTYSYRLVEENDNFFAQIGCTDGDYVTLKGMRKEYPYRIAFYTTKLVRCGEGFLYPESVGKEINHLKISTVSILTIDGKEQFRAQLERGEV